MLHLHDRASMQRALSDPALAGLLAPRVAALITPYGDLTDWTEFLIVQPGDTEDDIVSAIGFSPLIEPIDGKRYGEPGFAPGWDHISHRDGWYELVVTFGSTFAYVLLIEDTEGVPADLLALCRDYTGRSG